MEKALSGQVAVVTGASSGLGRRFATVLSEAGASVALAARRTDRLEAAVAEIEAAGGKAFAIALDVADTAAIGAALDKVEQALGPVSIMINNAGVGGDGLALEMTEEAFDTAFAVNVRGVFMGAREAAKRMLASGVADRGDARIINIASIAANTQFAGLSVYGASKAAVQSLTKGLAREWARSGIAVNAISPGYIATEINGAWLATEGGQRRIKGFPRRRVMDADVLDDAVLMLAGPKARYITGTIITIDDGQLL
jgi:NAD(P)-dependent dehydrogenase (short-subunit alcohol dehydrogenase family)